MPNLTGGKKYKSKKNASDAPIFVDKGSDQQYGRILKNLGDRNVLVYGNDNKIRLCHIRGAIRKDMWINVGDIVLISIRDELKQTDTYQRGDILHKYSSEQYGKLKDIINERLFLALEKYTEDDLKKMEGTGKVTLDISDDIFEYSKDDIDGI